MAVSEDGEASDDTECRSLIKAEKVVDTLLGLAVSDLSE